MSKLLGIELELGGVVHDKVDVVLLGKLRIGEQSILGEDSIHGGPHWLA